MKNEIKKHIRLDDVPAGGFEGVVEQTLLLSPKLFPAIVDNFDVCHGLNNFTYLSTGCYLPQSGATSHPHEDTDIVTFVLNGEVLHAGFNDDARVKPMQAHVQRSGSGIQHKETNTSEEHAKFVQMWFIAPQRGLKPEHQTIDISTNSLTTVLGGKDNTCFNNSMTCQIGTIKEGETLEHSDECILHIITGDALCGETKLSTGDLLNINDLSLIATTDVQVILVFNS